MTTGIIIGVVIGIVVSSIYWALIFSNNKKKVRRAQEERDKIIGPVAEKLADIDALMASFRSGLVQDEEFRKSLPLKLEAVNRLLKPNLHKLDVYYVKYVENLVRDFNRLAYRRSDKAKEIAEVMSSMEDVSYGEFQEESIEQEIKPDDEPRSDIAQSLIGIQAVESPLSQPKEEEMEISLDFSKIDAEEKAEVKDSDLVFNFEQQITDINEAEVIAESKEPQEIVEIKEPEEITKIDEAEEIRDAAVGAQVQEEEIGQQVTKFEEKTEEAEVAESFFKSLEIDEPEQAVEEELFEVEKIEERLQAAPIEEKKIEVEDEEFAMETIMDLDMSRLPRSPQDFPIELKIPSSPAPAEVSDFEENFKEIEATISDESEPEKFNLNIPEAAPAEEQSENLELHKEPAAAQPAEEMEFAFDLQDVVPDDDIFELELTSEQKEKTEEKQKPKQNESNNDTLTGDDIADKIDAFFKL
ncbi:MAG: hypothetical protein GX556_01430 [Fibrobacter sp.]|nr:hypothetical protein [Fibrobacter sp.]